jgi:D-alanyl-lipoteichoic acid acyltransferase DltB (MBOAT superfamily)
MSYIFFFPTFLAGPFFEYQKYIAFINQTSMTKVWLSANAPCMAVELMVPTC